MKYLIYISLFFFVSLFACSSEEKDKTPPVITLDGLNPFYLSKDSTYTDPGYSAQDDKDGDITAKVEVSGTLDISTEGTYYKYYNVKDEEGNAAEEKVREIRVVVL